MYQSKFLPKARAKGARVIDKLGLALALSVLAVGNAMAQTTPGDADPPSTLADAVTFLQTKGGIALACSIALTLIVIGLKGTKLPRRS